MLYEMGDASFKIGNVETDTYDTLMNSRLCRMVCKCSILESLPKCCDCAYQPYCGDLPGVKLCTGKRSGEPKKPQLPVPDL